jgi:hypothetical protein
LTNAALTTTDVSRVQCLLGHRREITRRSVENLEDLGGLALQRLVALGGALVVPPLEFRNCLLGSATALSERYMRSLGGPWLESVNDLAAWASRAGQLGKARFPPPDPAILRTGRGWPLRGMKTSSRRQDRTAVVGFEYGPSPLMIGAM